MGADRYRIVDLRPGVYTVTFRLTGFSVVKQEGISLTGSFTATVNAEMRVGAVEETITVTGESPTVDIQSVTQQVVLDKEVLDAIPAGRNHRMYAALIPGMSGGGSDVGGQNALSLGSVAIHGGRGNDQRVMVDGVTIRNVAGTGSISNFVPDMGSAQEVTVDYAALSAEAITGGVTFNYVPREGGNRFTGSFFGTGANSSFQGSNYTPELAAQGLTAPNRLKRVYRRQYVGWWAHPHRQVVVLLVRQVAREQQLRGGHVGEPQRWRSHEVALRTRPVPSRRVLHRPILHQHPPHVAGEREEQDQPVLGPSESEQSQRQRGDVPGVHAKLGVSTAPHRSGGLDFADQQPPPP